LTKYQILYWHDIPLQVRIRERGSRLSQQLSERFQVMVDNAAMAAGLTNDDAYLAGLQWSDTAERPGTPEAVLEQVVAELETQFSKINWRQTVARLDS